LNQVESLITTSKLEEVKIFVKEILSKVKALAETVCASICALEVQSRAKVIHTLALSFIGEESATKTSSSSSSSSELIEEENHEAIKPSKAQFPKKRKAPSGINVTITSSTISANYLLTNLHITTARLSIDTLL